MSRQDITDTAQFIRGDNAEFKGTEELAWKFGYKGRPKENSLEFNYVNFEESIVGGSSIRDI